ncbi:MAG TPA: nitroreductase family protein [bacterium]|nr:nitroreductase family protein [bacterium]
MSLIRNILKKILPSAVKQALVDLLSLMKSPLYHWRDGRRYAKYSGMIHHENDQVKLIARITMTYHGIEKGLTMPEMRPGFGMEAMNTLITLCDEYLRREYDATHCQFLHAVGVVEEYRKVHEEKGFTIAQPLLNKIVELTGKVRDVQRAEQIESGAAEYFKETSTPFDNFSGSRHSIRNFSDAEVEVESIKKAISLARNAPSSCNRQSPRAYIIQDKELIGKVLSLQNGNRGFGHLANKLVVVTAEQGVYNSIKERHSAWIDGGMFAMNLLYALHFHRIGACTLNCYFSPSAEDRVRALCGIPRSEVLVVIIALGAVPEKFRIPLSKRLSVDEIMRIR